MTPEISIIIPVYNASAFLSSTIKSVLRQDYHNYEIILINDGSTDNSPDICYHFAEKYKEIIKVINQKNKGVTIARKAGIEKSRGEFILFLDSDDTLPQQALSILFENSKGVDVVLGFDDAPETIPHKNPQILTQKQLINGFLTRKINPDIAAKLWKRSCFTPGCLDTSPSIKLGEDFIMNIKLSLNINKAKLVYKNTYHYIQHSQQTTRNFNYSLEYEKKLYTYLIEALGNNASIYKKNLLRYKLKRLKMLARFNFNYNPDDNFIKSTCIQSLKYILSFEDYIYIFTHRNKKVCSYILQKTAGFKRKCLGIYH